MATGREKAYEHVFPEVYKEKGEPKPKRPRFSMKNNSKGSVRRVQEKGKKERMGKEEKHKPCCLLLKAPCNKELNPFVGSKPDGQGWVKIKGVMDPGHLKAWRHQRRAPITK